MELLTQIEAAVCKAGEIVLSAQYVEHSVEEKTSAADLVTAYDKQVEVFLKQELLSLLPEAIFFGEEEAENGNPSQGWAFIVDPIDGTANFVRGMAHSAISVALAKDGVVMYAAVLNPYRSEMFTAVHGNGAYLNGQPIHVSQRPLSQGIFAMGTAPYHQQLHNSTLNLTQQLLACSCDFRRMGAAALDLCDVACGRVEAFFEYMLSPWDYAAGSLLVSEAGGCVYTLEGMPLKLHQGSSLWASNAVNQRLIQQMSV